jgi:predicted 2-oxoglutarate/Fe(II)-dependent dioxygenase YbiX
MYNIPASEASLIIYKSSSLAAVLAVTKFVRIIIINLVTLAVSLKSDLDPFITVGVGK